MSPAAFGRLSLMLLLGLALLSGWATACREAPAQSPAAPASIQPAAPTAAYAVDTLRIRRDSRASLLAVRVAYPRLRPCPGTAPADTLGLRAFNRQAKAFATGLVKEIDATARDNRADKLPTALRVSFRPYLLRCGLASVAFTVSQEGIGPRPITWATGLTYDVRTGRQLRPANLFRQDNTFKKMVLSALQPKLAGNDDCELEPDNMAWDNFALGPDAYYLLLGDAQVGRACGTRAVRLPLSQLQPLASAGSPAARLLVH